MTDEPSPRNPLTRRAFLGGLAAVGVAACSGGDDDGTAAPSSTTTSSTVPVPPLPDDPFTLGVASGDPLPGAVVLWTRLAPDPLVPGGGMPDVDVPVRWQVATDDAFVDVVAENEEVTGAALAYSVHADVTGLEPATTYSYRFTVGDHTSPAGRTRTLPSTDSSPESFRFAVANCHAWQTGYFTAYRHLADEDVDVVLFVGDYMYELESSREVRPHDLAVPTTLEGYRAFYSLNKTDTDLQAAHAAHPWIVTWDDHEVEDNYAAFEPGAVGSAMTDDAEAAFPAKRAAAYRAWWEHMPVRVPPPEEGAEVRIYRSFQVGDLATLPVLDGRQYRTSLPAGEGFGNLPRAAGGGPQLEGAFDPDATMLGADQEAWLTELLAGSDTTWNVIVQQSVMAEVDRAPDDPDRGFSMDAWDGYVAARDRLLGALHDARVSNVVSVGGDIHTSTVTDLLTTYHRDDAEQVGTEFISPPIDALELLPEGYPAQALTNPHIHLFDIESKGYLLCAVTGDELRADYRYVTTYTEPDGDVTTGTSWVVASGTPGATPV